MDGLLDRLADFGYSLKGSAGELIWDNQEIVDHRTTVTLDNHAWENVLPGRADNYSGRRLKYYHPKHPRTSGGDEDPLFHPKLEIQFANDNSEIGSGPWSSVDEFDAADLEVELDETLVSALSWAGFTPRATPHEYVADPYFECTEDTREVVVHPDHIPTLREHEHDLARDEFARPDATTADPELMEVLTDGGRGMHWSELAEQADRSKSSVYRFTQRFPDVFRTTQGTVDFEDEVVRRKMRELLDGLEDHFSLVESGLSYLTKDRDKLLPENSAFARWARRHHVTPHNDRDRLVLELTGQHSKDEVV